MCIRDSGWCVPNFSFLKRAFRVKRAKTSFQNFAPYFLGEIDMMSISRKLAACAVWLAVASSAAVVASPSPTASVDPVIVGSFEFHGRLDSGEPVIIERLEFRGIDSKLLDVFRDRIKTQVGHVLDPIQPARDFEDILSLGILDVKRCRVNLYQGNTGGVAVVFQLVKIQTNEKS
jgi:hypothetical protein